MPRRKSKRELLPAAVGYIAGRFYLRIYGQMFHTLWIYESLSNQAAHYLQSMDRIHRRGQDRPVEYFILLCEDSLEIGEYDRLVAKEKSQGALLGDRPAQIVSRKSMLAESIEALDRLEPRSGIR